MSVKSILIWLKEFEFGENKLANFGLSFFGLAKILTKQFKTLAQALFAIRMPEIAAVWSCEQSNYYLFVAFSAW